VIDSGAGIKDCDKHKLFQLFGFLEQNKEINTNGIGLGLHISKMIV
jgi:K+-sensing histidine kinase KdpD